MFISASFLDIFFNSISNTGSDSAVLSFCHFGDSLMVKFVFTILISIK